MDIEDTRGEQLELFPQEQQDHTEYEHIMEAVLFVHYLLQGNTLFH